MVILENTGIDFIRGIFVWNITSAIYVLELFFLKTKILHLFVASESRPLTDSHTSMYGYEKKLLILSTQILLILKIHPGFKFPFSSL